MAHSENSTRKSVTSEIKLDPSLPSEEFTRLLVQHLKGLNLQSDATEMEHHLTLDLWDFAGQRVYYASHPIFLSPRAVYMLVYNLSKELKDTAQPCVRQGGVDSPLKNPNNETNLENLLSWLVSVSTMCSMDESKDKDLPYLRPPVFIVGTHADKPFQDIKEIELQIQREIFGKGYDGHVIRPLFSVDNTQGSSGGGVSALQKRMIEVLKQEPYMGEEVPLRWLNFEKVVEALVAEKTYYLQLEQLQTIIQKVCFIDNENEIKTMLDFYHDLGKIVKHRSMVVLRTQWLIDLLRQLITIPTFNTMEPRYAKLWKKLQDTGVLSMELADHVFSKFCQQGLIKQDILNMMEHFGLIVNFATSPVEVAYFVPALLKSPPGRLCKMALSPSDPCPLYIHFLEGFVPHGLYSHLVSRCTRWCSEREFKQSPYLFDGASRFVIDKAQTHQLILVCKKRLIKVILKHSKPGDEVSLAEAEAEAVEVASLVRGFLEATLHGLSRELSWLSNLKYELCVSCPNCPEDEKACPNHGQVSCTDEDCLCLLNILPGDKLSTCAKCICDEGAIPPSLKKWLTVKAVRPGKLEDDVHNTTALGSDKQSTNHGLDVFSKRTTSQEVHPSLFGTSCGQPGGSYDTLKIALLASEWGSSKGGLSTMNRTLATLFAKQSNVEITLLVPQFSCGEEDKRTARSHNIAIREARRRPGYGDPLDWLSCPPKDLAIDVVVGHGAKLGKQAQFIRESHGCKWVQVVHTEPEELGMYKNYPRAIAQGEEKSKDEVALCRIADLVVAVGPKLREAFSSYLRSSRQHIFQLTPGTFHEFSDIKQAPDEVGKFKVLTFGRGDYEDISLKGYDIAASAIAELKDNSYRLIFVGAPDGKQEEVADNLLQVGISKNQLFVRRFVQSKDELKDLFCEVDLAIMPSRTEGFGLTALEAMSAGLPILVSGNSGFGETLCSLPFGRSVVVESEDPKEWAKAISAVRQKDRAQRLQEIQTLRAKYEEKFSWETQCQALVDRMRKVVRDRDMMCTT